MRVFDIDVRSEADSAELHARVRFATHWVWGHEPFQLWYRFPEEFGGWLSDRNGDPFLAALLAPAMALGEPLEIDAAVSAKLLRAAAEIQSIYRRWDRKLQPVAVRTTAQDDRSSARLSGGSGLFFSLGVDSTYSLLKREGASLGDADGITHLINVFGFDIDLWEADPYAVVLANIEQVAGALGKVAVPVATNLRDLSDRIVDWPRLYHGAALASVGLCLRGAFERIYIAASGTYDVLRPLGSHPRLDPLWSTEELSFVHDGCEADRLDKLRLLSSSPLAMRSLRVCAADEATGGYNCGECDKCVHTSIGLWVLGRLSACETLADRIDPRRVSELKVVSEGEVAYYRRVLERLGSSDLHLEVKSALEEALAKSGVA